MKLILVGLDGVSLPVLLDDDRLLNLHRLADFGCYGLLAGQLSGQAWDSLFDGDVWHEIEAADGAVFVIDPTSRFLSESDKESVRVNAAVFAAARSVVRRERWDFVQLVEDGFLRLLPDAAADFLLQVDVALGDLLEELDAESVVMVVARGSAGEPHAEEAGVFLLAAPNCLLAGEVEGVQLADIAPSLLELGGYPSSGPAQGRSFVSGHLIADGDVLSDDEAALLRERLSGLGYVG